MTHRKRPAHSVSGVALLFGCSVLLTACGGGVQPTDDSSTQAGTEQADPNNDVDTDATRWWWRRLTNRNPHRHQNRRRHLLRASADTAPVPRRLRPGTRSSPTRCQHPRPLDSEANAAPAPTPTPTPHLLHTDSNATPALPRADANAGSVPAPTPTPTPAPVPAPTPTPTPSRLPPVGWIELRRALRAAWRREVRRLRLGSGVQHRLRRNERAYGQNSVCSRVGHIGLHAATRDTSVKASGDSSLKFTIPANSGSDSAGSYFTNFSTIVGAV